MDEHEDSGVAEWLLSGLDEAEPEAPRLPEVLGPYRLGRLLGRGATSAVFVARDQREQIDVALKVVSISALSPARVERMKLEVSALRRLAHPGIVRVLNAGRIGELVFLALEWVKGETLAARIQREGPLSEQTSLELVRRLALAVAHAHEHQVLHRDIKPSNVLLDALGQPRLTDFGLARLEDRVTRHTAESDVLGTPGFMAPEQAGGRLAPLGPPVDVYGLGATLYACISGGTPPLEASTLQAFLEALETRRPRSLRELRPGISRTTEALCRRCLEHDPAARFPSAAALASALDAALHAPAERAGWRAWPSLVGALVGAAGVGLLLVGVPADRTPPATAQAVSLEAIAALADEGDREGALRALAQAPDSAEAAWLEYRLRAEVPAEAPQAAEALARTLRTDPKHPLAVQARAEALLRAERHEEAGVLLARVGDSAPNLPAVWALRGEVHARQGDFASAAEAFRRATLGGEPHAARWAYALLESGEFAQAADVAREALRRDGENAELRRTLVDSLLRTQPREALNAAEAWRLALPADDDAHRITGELRLRLGDPYGAEAPLREALRLKPDAPGTIGLLAECFKDRGENERALEIYDRALQRTPDLPGLWNNRAGALIELGRFVEARESYDRAIALGGHLPLLLAHRAVAWSREGNLEAALQDAREAVRRAPTDPKIQVILAELLRQAGRWEELLDATERVLALAPGDFYARTLRASALGQLGRHPEALTCLEALERDFPQSGEVVLGKAQALHALGRLEPARAAAERALTLQGGPVFTQRVREFLDQLR